jgi:hypothetical protein
MDNLIPVTEGKTYTTNSNIKVYFYDKDHNPVNNIDVLIKKYKNKESFKIPKGIETISVRFVNK